MVPIPAIWFPFGASGWASPQTDHCAVLGQVRRRCARYWTDEAPTGRASAGRAEPLGRSRGELLIAPNLTTGGVTASALARATTEPVGDLASSTVSTARPYSDATARARAITRGI